LVQPGIKKLLWKLFNFAGDVVQEGGPYSTPGDIKMIELEFGTSSCFRLEMYDSGNDGFGDNGFYQVVYGTNSTAFSGGSFEDKDVNEITYDIVGVEEQEVAKNFTVYPNPASNNLSVSITLNNKQPIKVMLYDMLGSTIAEKNLGMQHEGSVTTTFNVSKLETGVYLIKVLAGEKTYINKVFVK